MNTAVIRTHTLRPASGRVLACALPAWPLDQYPCPMPELQANLWACDVQDQVQPGGASA
ncbi:MULTISPECIES: hypothetical protein [unclassified Variovorax]|uniref:hypothetical protein n=1 Tax=unclassified Variovorax TaxID=663243 RepID=UPI0015A72AE8|nr:MULTISPECIES: hypothetical protein [unclassified Variovorax]